MGLKLDIVLTLNNADAVASGLTNVGTKVEGVGVKVRKSGKELEDGLGGVGAQLQRMQGFLLGFVAFDKLTDWAGQAIQLADGWALLNAKLEVATGSSTAAQASMGELYTLAQDLRVPLSETATLFGRLTPALREFGGGTAEAMRMTEALSLSLKVSGATQAEAGSAMLQFSQAMSAGALSGEEFNSMADAAPRLLQALADGLGVSRGALKGLAEEGKFTTDVVYAALANQVPVLEKEFNKLPLTVGDAWAKMGNATLKGVGEFNQGIKITEKLAASLDALTNYIPQLINGFVLLTELTTAYFVVMKGGPLIIGTTTAAFGLLQGAMLQWRLGAMSGATTWQLLNSSLIATPPAAAAASTSLTVLKYAAAALAAFFVGWEIGTYLHENFEFARVSGIAFVSALLTGWEQLKYYGQAAWEVLKFGFLNFFIEPTKQQFSGFLGLIADGLGKIGKTDLAEKFQGWSDSLAKPAYSAQQLDGRLKALGETRDKELALINTTIDAMYEDEIQRNNVSTATNKLNTAQGTLNKTSGLSAKESEKLQTKFDKLTKALGDQTTSLQLSANGQKQLTKTQELTAKASEFLTKMGDQLTASQKQQLQAFIQTLPQLEKQSEAQLKLAKAQEEHKRKLDDSLKSLDADLKKAIEERDSLGKTEIQVRQLAVQRDRETLATLQARAAKESHNQALQHEIGVLEQRIAKGEQLIVVLKDTEGWKAQQKHIEENTEYWNKFTDDIGRNFTDGFQRMLEDGKGGWESLVDSLKNTFKRVLVDWIYNAFAKPIMLNLTSSMSGQSSGVSSLMGMVNGGSTSGSMMGMGGSSSGAGAFMASPWVALIAAGMMMSDSAFSKGYNENTFSYTDAWLKTGGLAPVTMKADTKLLQSLGLDQRTANVITGASLWSSAFGSGAKKVQSFGIEGTFSGDDFSGQNYEKWKKKGGWFSSSKHGTDRSAMDAEFDNTLDATFTTLKSNISGFAKSLGIDASKISSYSKKISLELSEDEAENNERLAKLFGSMADEMTRMIAPKVSYFRRDGETISQTFERLAGAFNVTNAATSLLGANWEEAFNSMNIGSSVARQALIDFSGGLESFSQKVNFYYENFYTDAEKNARTFAELDARFDKLGVSLDLNKESFRAAMEQIEIANDPARYAAFLDIAPLFTQLLGSMGDSAAGKTIGVGVDAQGLTDKQLASINQSVDTWWQTYQPELKAQTDQATKTTDAILNLTSISAASSEAIRAEVANGNTQLAGVISAIQASNMSTEAQGRAIADAIAQSTRSTMSAMEFAVLSNSRA